MDDQVIAQIIGLFVIERNDLHFVQNAYRSNASLSLYLFSTMV